MTPPTGDVQAQKSDLRRRLLAVRTALVGTAEPDYRRTTALLDYLHLFGARCVALYVSVDREPDTAELRDALRAAGVTVLLPVLQPDDTLTFAVDEGVCVPGRRGVPIPTGEVRPLETAEAVLVPALAVDRRGVRLGRGGGSYDRALATLHQRVRVLALLHPGELVESLPAEPHDVRVAAVALPDGIVQLDQAGSSG